MNPIMFNFGPIFNVATHHELGSHVGKNAKSGRKLSRKNRSSLSENQTGDADYRTGDKVLYPILLIQQRSQRNEGECVFDRT